MKPYLYLAPRGQAKTYELIRQAVNLAADNTEVVIFCHSERNAGFIKEKMGESFSYSKNIIVLGNLSEVEKLPVTMVRMFDEFDIIFKDYKGEFKIRASDRFYGTPIKKRNIGKFEKDDILYKILEANDGRFDGRMWPICVSGIHLRDIKKGMSKDQYDLEILGNFWEAE